MFKRSLVAIDIGASSVKLLELDNNGDVLLRAGQTSLPSGCVTDGSIIDPLPVKQAIKQLANELNVQTFLRRVSISMGGSPVIIKRVNFSTAIDLVDTIHYEAEQHFQYDINDLYFDYYQYAVPEGDDEVPVILVGAKRNQVEMYIDCLKSAGFKIGVIDCSALALANIYERAYLPDISDIHSPIPSGLILIVNVGSSTTQLVFLSQREFLFNREVAMAGGAISRDLAARLGVNLAAGEDLKIRYSEGREGIPESVAPIIRELVDQLVEEIRISIDFYFDQAVNAGDYNTVNKVYITGQGSLVRGFQKRLGEVLGLSVERFNPMAKFTSDEVISGTAYGVAAGLALRNFDLAF